MDQVTVRTMDGDGVSAHPDRVARLVELGILRELREGVYVLREEVSTNLKEAFSAAFDLSGVFL